MLNKELVLEVLRKIEDSAQKVIDFKRLSPGGIPQADSG